MADPTLDPESLPPVYTTNHPNVRQRIKFLNDRVDTLQAEVKHLKRVINKVADDKNRIIMELQRTLEYHQLKDRSD